METYCCNDTKIFKIFASKPSTSFNITFNNVRIKTLPWDLALDQPGRQSAKCNEGHKVYTNLKNTSSTAMSEPNTT